MVAKTNCKQNKVRVQMYHKPCLSMMLVLWLSYLCPVHLERWFSSNSLIFALISLIGNTLLSTGREAYLWHSRCQTSLSSFTMLFDFASYACLSKQLVMIFYDLFVNIENVPILTHVFITFSEGFFRNGTAGKCRELFF